MLLQRLAVSCVPSLKSRMLSGEFRDFLRETSFEHEGESALKLVGLEVRVRRIFKGVTIGPVWQHCIVQRDAAGREAAAGLGVINAVDQAHKLAHDVHVVPWRTEGIFGDQPSVGEDNEIDVCGAGCFKTSGMSKRSAVFARKKSTAFGPFSMKASTRSLSKLFPVSWRRYVRARSGDSLIPHALASDVPGIHSQPPERAVVPPNFGSFSTMSTLSPCFAAVTAALMPDAPEPMTKTSHSYLSSTAIFNSSSCRATCRIAQTISCVSTRNVDISAMNSEA